MNSIIRAPRHPTSKEIHLESHRITSWVETIFPTHESFLMNPTKRRGKQ